jgi:hypothetical protein
MRGYIALMGALSLAVATPIAQGAPVGAPELFKGCMDLAKLRSPASGQPATINFLNKTKGNVNVIGIDATGSQKQRGTLGPGEHLNQVTFIGAAWLITDDGGNCLGAFETTGSQGLILKEPADGALDWGIRSSYDAVGTYTYLNNPSFECFRTFPQYDMKKSMTIYTKAIIYCTTLIAIIGYDAKHQYQ